MFDIEIIFEVSESWPKTSRDEDESNEEIDRETNWLISECHVYAAALEQCRSSVLAKLGPSRRSIAFPNKLERVAWNEARQKQKWTRWYEQRAYKCIA